MSNTNKARKFAAEHHANQFDKAGEPYIKHLEYVSDCVNSDEAKTVALLHDILEDTDCQVGDLSVAGFDTEIIDAVVAITKVAGEPYDDYIARVKANPLAREVKIADMTHNSDLSRLGHVTAKDLQRAEKYRHYLMELTRF